MVDAHMPTSTSLWKSQVGSSCEVTKNANSVVKHKIYPNANTSIIGILVCEMVNCRFCKSGTCILWGIDWIACFLIVHTQLYKSVHYWKPQVGGLIQLYCHSWKDFQLCLPLSSIAYTGRWVNVPPNQILTWQRPILFCEMRKDTSCLKWKVP